MVVVLCFKLISGSGFVTSKAGLSPVGETPAADPAMVIPVPATDKSRLLKVAVPLTAVTLVVAVPPKVPVVDNPTDAVKSRSLLSRPSMASMVGEGFITAFNETVEGVTLKTRLVAVTSILLLSPEVEVAAPPALAAANPDPDAEAVAEFTVSENCWLSVTAAVKLTLTEKVLLELSGAVRVNPEKAAVEPPATSARLLVPSNSAIRRIDEELATLKVMAVRMVDSASGSERVAPPSRISNWATSMELPVVNGLVPW